jgi:hypothetical protein
VDILGKALLLLRPEIFTIVSCPKDNGWQANDCVDLYRDVEHVKHPLQGAHSHPVHMKLDAAHEYAKRLQASAEAFVGDGRRLPPQLFHYARPRNEVLLQQIAHERYGAVESC